LYSAEIPAIQALSSHFLRVFITFITVNALSIESTRPLFSSFRSGFRVSKSIILGSALLAGKMLWAMAWGFGSAGGGSDCVSACADGAPRPMDSAMALIFASAVGSERTFFSFSEKSLSKVHPAFTKHIHNLLALFSAGGIDKALRLLLA